MEHHDILVLGSGISGSAFAHFFSKPVLVLEKESKPGGLCRSFRQDGFVWDCAGHFLHFQNLDMQRYLKRLLGSQLIEKQKKTKILFHDMYIDYPFQNNIHQLPFSIFIKALWSYLFRKKRQVQSFKDYLVSRYGLVICHLFLFPYNQKLYGCDLNILNPNAMGRFFPQTSLIDLAKSVLFRQSALSYNDTFFYVKDGIEVVINKLLPSVNLNETVVHIDLHKKQIKTTKQTYSYNTLVNTVSLNQFLKLTNDSTLNLSYSSVIVFNIGFVGTTPIKEHWLYIPEKKYCFYRVGFYNNIRDEKHMSLYVEVSITGEISEDALFAKVLNDLKKASIVTSQKLKSWNSVYISPAYVHLSNQQEIQSYISLLRSKDVYMLGRYAEWKYCSIEDAILGAKQLAKNLNKNK